MKKILSLLLVLLFNINTSFAAISSFTFSWKYRFMPIPTTIDKQIHYTYNIISKDKVIYEISMNDLYYSNIFIINLWSKKDFIKDRLYKEEFLERGLSSISDRILQINNVQYYLKEKNWFKKYKKDLEWKKNFFYDKDNYIIICWEDLMASWKSSEYVKLNCFTTPDYFFYSKDLWKLILTEEDKKEYQEFYKKQEEEKIKQRQEELAYLEKTNKYFDENKVEKSRYWTKSRIKTSEELQNLIINDVEDVDFSRISVEGVASNLAGKYFTYDDNDRVFANYTDFKNYVLYTIKEYIYQKEHPETNQNSNTITTENKLNNNSTSDIEKFKEQNAKDRAKAIDFSKNLLKILEKYKTKEEKLEKLEYIKEIINTKYTPEKFKNQNLIWYVKDYLDIVEYAINLQ